VLYWNVHGVNSSKKWNSIRDKISEAQCDVICLQETKHDFFDSAYLRKFCPPMFDQFCFIPSVGASGGMIVAWKGSMFQGNLIF